MKVRFSQADEFRGKEYKADEKADLPDGVAFKLIGKGLARKITDAEFEAFDINEALDSDDFNVLKVDELKEVCKHLELGTSGNKADLIASIVQKLGKGDLNSTLPDMSEMDIGDLRVLADQEGVTLPDDADEASIREIMADALSNKGEK